METTLFTLPPPSSTCRIPKIPLPQPSSPPFHHRIPPQTQPTNPYYPLSNQPHKERGNCRNSQTTAPRLPPHRRNQLQRLHRPTVPTAPYDVPGNI
ncbi:hypothetical protein R6Q59_019655 [Mikania micrantha]